MTSQILTYTTGLLSFAVFAGMAYIQLPYTTRKVERVLRAVMSPVTLLIYILAVLAAAFSAVGY